MIKREWGNQIAAGRGNTDGRIFPNDFYNAGSGRYFGWMYEGNRRKAHGTAGGRTGSDGGIQRYQLRAFGELDE